MVLLGDVREAVVGRGILASLLGSLRKAASGSAPWVSCEHVEGLLGTSGHPGRGDG